MFLKDLGKAALLMAVLASCGKDRVQVSDTGLKYQLHDQNTDARKAKVGDVMTIQPDAEKQQGLLCCVIRTKKVLR